MELKSDDLFFIKSFYEKYKIREVIRENDKIEKKRARKEVNVELSIVK